MKISFNTSLPYQKIQNNNKISLYRPQIKLAQATADTFTFGKKYEDDMDDIDDFAFISVDDNKDEQAPIEDNDEGENSDKDNNNTKLSIFEKVFLYTLPLALFSIYLDACTPFGKMSRSLQDIEQSAQEMEQNLENIDKNLENQIEQLNEKIDSLPDEEEFDELERRLEELIKQHEGEF